MTKTETIICDGCERDLTYTGNSVDYRLVLASESKPYHPSTNYVTDMMIYPPIQRTHHFCSLYCLDAWRNRKDDDD